MSSASDINSKSVPELKQFLTDRGIKTTGYKRNELRDLANEALEQSITTKSQLNDDSKVVLERRTVNGKTFPHPSLSDIKWNDNLYDIPTIESFDVQYYLKMKCGWTNERLKSYKNDHSYRLHTNGHISNVKLTVLDDKYRYVRAQCTPEERQSASPYDLWILLDIDGVVNSGECTCVA